MSSPQIPDSAPDFSAGSGYLLVALSQRVTRAPDGTFKLGPVIRIVGQVPERDPELDLIALRDAYNQIAWRLTLRLEDQGWRVDDPSKPDDVGHGQPRLQ